jgi:hypothetical protein
LFSLNRQLVNGILVGIPFIAGLRLDKINFMFGQASLLGNFLPENSLLAVVILALGVNIMELICIISHEKGLVLIGRHILLSFN